MLELVRGLRLHQWAKNLLIFVPVFTAHRLLDPPILGRAAVAFFAFSLAASAGYLFNDLIDLEADRQHPRKVNRPLASGRLAPRIALTAIPALLLFSLGCGARLPREFLAMLGAYIVASGFYSILGKQIAILDVILLAGLYSLRIVAGTEATQVAYSAWLLAFAMFLFSSLAFLKRYSELLLLPSDDAVAPGRGYARSDLQLVCAFGIASGYLSILVFALYINSREVVALYSRPNVLWLLAPVFLYFVSRLWLVAHRRQMHDDPILFVFKDPISITLGLLAVSITFLAR